MNGLACNCIISFPCSLIFFQLQDQGGVSVSTAIQAVAQQITDVQTELKGVVEKIDQEEAKPKASQDEKRLERLSKREDQLRDKEARLQEKELILLRQSGANSKPVHLLSFPTLLFPSLFFLRVVASSLFHHSLSLYLLHLFL